MRQCPKCPCPNQLRPKCPDAPLRLALRRPRGEELDEVERPALEPGGGTHAERTVHLIWLGTMRALTMGLFMVLPRLMLVSRVTGAPPTRTVNAPVIGLVGAMTVCETRPIATPRLSPFVRGMVVSRLWVGVNMERM